MCIYPSLLATRCRCARTATEMLAPTSCSFQGQHAGRQVHTYENVKVKNKFELLYQAQDISRSGTKYQPTNTIQAYNLCTNVTTSMIISPS